MAKNLADLRFTVRTADGFGGSDWRLWATRHGDFYLASRSLASKLKLSFHQSGICRYAFTAEHGAPVGQANRKLFGWRRAAVPVRGAGGMARVAWLAVPSDYLSYTPGFSSDGWSCVPSAPKSGATYFQLCLT